MHTMLTTIPSPPPECHYDMVYTFQFGDAPNRYMFSTSRWLTCCSVLFEYYIVSS